MESERNHIAFFALLRAGISDFDFDVDLRSSSVATRDSSSKLGSPLAAPSVDFNHVDWQWVEDYALKHGVLPLLFDGYKKYVEQNPGFKSMPTERMLRWYAVAQQAERNYATHRQAIRTLSDYLAEKGIRTIVLKGYGLSQCYPVPSHRQCGDIDIYQYGDWRKADELLAKNAAVKVDRSHHHHTVYRWNGVSVENHYDFVNVYTHPIHKEVERRLKELAEREEPMRTEDGILLPSPNVAALFTMVHSLTEWVGESVPMRQVADWWLLRRKLGKEIDWELIERTCREVGFDEFLKVWTEVSDWLFDADVNPDFDLDRLSATGQRVLLDLLMPEYGRGEGRRGLVWWWFRLRRWFGNRWKMRLAYRKESLLEQFVMHCKSHLLRPEKLLEE